VTTPRRTHKSASHQYGSSLSNQQWYYGHKNVNGLSVLWKLPTYVAAAKVVVCNEEFRASTRRHKTWRRNSYAVENHNCGINSPQQETTETSDDLHGKSERMQAMIKNRMPRALSKWVRIHLLKDFTLAHNSFICYRTRWFLVLWTIAFLEKWIDTDAPFAYSTCMQSSGDDVSQGTEWKRDECSVYIASRMLEYNHVVHCASRSPHGQGSKRNNAIENFEKWNCL
jgi:hypothetical protein